MSGRRHRTAASTWPVVAALAALVATACAPDGPDAAGPEGVSDPAARRPAATSRPTIDDADRIESATVTVRATGCGPRPRSGVGTVIRDRTIVTVAHVVAGSDSVEVVAADGRTVTVDVVHFDPELDLAVLRAGRDVGSPLPSQSTSVTDGAATVALPRLAGSDGHVGLLDVEVVRRVTIRTTDIYREAEVERRGTEVVADIEPGDSGAMVHAAGGNAGIIWARSNVRSGRAWSVELPDAVVGRAPALERPVDVQHCVD